MIKKCFVAFLLGLTAILLLSSCSLGGENIFSRFNDDDEEVALENFKKILTAIEENDSQVLKELFAKTTSFEVADLSESINKLMDFVEGKVTSIDDWGGPATYGGINEDGSGRVWKDIESTFDVETTEGKYRFAVQLYTNDTANKDNVGVHSIYVIKAEDDPDSECAYGGDGKWTPGINFNMH